MYKKNKKSFLQITTWAFAVFAFANNIKAQDIHFSQFDETPVQLNPATVGVQHEVRGILNFKNQWQSIGSPYRTYAFSFDARLLKNKKHHLGLGLDFFSDKAGDASLGSNQVNLSIAGLINLNDKSILSGGIVAGFGQRSMNASKLTWGNQYNGTNYDANAATGETSLPGSFTMFDLGAGLQYNYGTDEAYISANNARKISLGVAVFHPHRPAYSFYGGGERLNMKIVLNGNASIGMPNSNLILKPSYIVFIQGAATEINPGMTFQYVLQEGSKYTGLKKSSAFSLGAYYRLKDAFIAIAKFEYSNYCIGFSYDVNLSKLKVASSARGGFEISLRWVYPSMFGNKHFKSRI
jgi:type IX secretion system PorP/SprF family membrane protein